MRINRIFILFVLAIMLGCSNSEPPVVKPDKARTNDSKLIESIGKTTSTMSTQTIQENQIPDLKMLYGKHKNKAMLIELACGYYHDSFNKMPSSLEDILNGFMLIWPVNAYSDGPIVSLGLPPDPQNKNDIGNIYYNQINTHEAEIQYLRPLALSVPDSTEWEIVTDAVYSDSANYLVKSAEQEKNPATQIGYQICSKKPSERREFGFKVNLRQELVFPLFGSIASRGALHNTFHELLTDSKYYVLEEGLIVLKNTVKSGDLNFSIGKFKDGTAFYYCYAYTEKMMLNCSRFNPNAGDRGGIEFDVECPKSTEGSISIFSSENVSSLEIPDDLLISKQDILQS
ncbi:MAG: hypothetical protein ABIG42_05015 [bacterium]